MNAVTTIKKHTAAGPYLGYALQPVRLCYHLLTCPEGAKASLEHLDDVAVHRADGSELLEQTKSALSQNPLSNWAGDLWKTLDFWLSAIETGEIDGATASFQYYVTPAKTGKFAEALHQAKSAADADTVITDLETRWTNQTKKPACSAQVKHLLQADLAVRRAFIQSVSILSDDDDPVEPIRALFKFAVDPEVLDLICERAIGGAKETIDRLIRTGEPQIMNGDAFKAELRAFIQKNNLPGLLISFTETPAKEAVSKLFEDRPVFLKQLEWIDLDIDSQVRAVSDYLRTAADISVWGEKGMIFPKNLAEWNDGLFGRFTLLAGEVEDVLAHLPSPSRGRTVYRRCAALQEPLEGRVVPGHFVNGSFNALAEDRRLGWHPDYKTFLDSDT